MTTQLALSFEEKQRLAKQTAAVWEVMKDGAWRTLAEIRVALFMNGYVAGEPSISARLRELRSLGHQVDRRARKPHVFEYRAWNRI